MQTQTRTSQGTGGRAGIAAQLTGLFVLETRRLLRGWRWRTLLLLNAAVALVLARAADWGEGAAVFFPGGLTGLRSVGFLYAGAAIVLATDLAGQADRYHAQLLYSVRPVSGLVLQCSRFASLVTVMAPLIVATCVLPPALVKLRGEDTLSAPNVLVLWGHYLPLVAVSVAGGLAARSWVRNDPAALAAAALGVGPLVWIALFDSRPEELFLSSSRILGVLVPGSETAGTAVIVGLATLPFLGLAALKPRLVHGSTPLRQLVPPRRSAVASFRTALSHVPVPRSIGTPTLAVSLLAIVAGMGALGDSCRKAVVALTLPAPDAMVADWSVMQQPPEAEQGIVRVPVVAARTVVMDSMEEDRIFVTLSLLASAGDLQSLAGVTFGPACRIESVERPEGRVEVVPGATSEHLHASVLRFDPPLRRNVASDVRFELRPNPRLARAWARLRHPAYATFQDLPLWYGEGVRIRYHFNDFAVSQQPAPFELSLPVPGARSWIAGAAQTREGDDHIELMSTRAAIPSSVFAADMSVVRPVETQPIPVHFIVFPEHEELARSLLTIFENRFERLARVFGERENPLVYIEVPGQQREDAFAIPSPVLDRLMTLLPDYDSLRDPTAGEFEESFRRMHEAAVATLITQPWDSFEQPELMREALIRYLHTFGFREGRTYEFRRERRDFALVPWEWVRPADRYPFDLWPRDEGAFRGPVHPDLRPGELPSVPMERLMAFHHMLRGRLGDTEYSGLLHDLFRTGGERLTVEAYRRAAEARAGKSLETFFDQWLMEGVIPEYRLVEAQVVLAENVETRDLEYTTTVKVRNEGTGRIPVEVRLETEGDRVEKTVEPVPGEDTTLIFITADRPVSVAVDPDGWVVQMPEFDQRAGRPVHPRLFLKTVREL